jgi:hypothetical protein
VCVACIGVESAECTPCEACAPCIPFLACGGQQLPTPTQPTPTPLTSNVALNKQGRQSSVKDGGTAARAVDGNRAMRAGASCTHTADGRGEWFQVDLGANYAVQSVDIFRRLPDSEYSCGDICGPGFVLTHEAKSWTHPDKPQEQQECGATADYCATNTKPSGCWMDGSCVGTQAFMQNTACCVPSPSIGARGVVRLSLVSDINSGIDCFGIRGSEAQPERGSCEGKFGRFITVKGPPNGKLMSICELEVEGQLLEDADATAMCSAPAVAHGRYTNPAQFQHADGELLRTRTQVPPDWALAFSDCPTWGHIATAAKAGYTCDDVCGPGFSLVRSATYTDVAKPAEELQCGDTADYCAANTDPSHCRVDGSCADTQTYMQENGCCVPEPFVGEHCPVFVLVWTDELCPNGDCDYNHDAFKAICNEWQANDYDNGCFRSTQRFPCGELHDKFVEACGEMTTGTAAVASCSQPPSPPSPTVSGRRLQTETSEGGKREVTDAELVKICAEFSDADSACSQNALAKQHLRSLCPGSAAIGGGLGTDYTCDDDDVCRPGFSLVRSATYTDSDNPADERQCGDAADYCATNIDPSHCRVAGSCASAQGFMHDNGCCAPDYTCDDVCGPGFSLVRSATYTDVANPADELQCEGAADYCATNTDPSHCRVAGSCAGTQLHMQQTDCCAPDYTCDDVCGPGFSLVRSATYIDPDQPEEETGCGTTADYCNANTDPGKCWIDGSCSGLHTWMQKTPCCEPLDDAATAAAASGSARSSCLCGQAEFFPNKQLPNWAIGRTCRTEASHACGQWQLEGNEEAIGYVKMHCCGAVDEASCADRDDEFAAECAAAEECPGDTLGSNDCQGAAAAGWCTLAPKEWIEARCPQSCGACQGTPAAAVAAVVDTFTCDEGYSRSQTVDFTCSCGGDVAAYLSKSATCPPGYTFPETAEACEAAAILLGAPDTTADVSEDTSLPVCSMQPNNLFSLHFAAGGCRTGRTGCRTSHNAVCVLEASGAGPCVSVKPGDQATTLGTFAADGATGLRPVRVGDTATQPGLFCPCVALAEGAQLPLVAGTFYPYNLPDTGSASHGRCCHS